MSILSDLIAKVDDLASRVAGEFNAIRTAVTNLRLQDIQGGELLYTENVQDDDVAMFISDRGDGIPGMFVSKIHVENMGTELINGSDSTPTLRTLDDSGGGAEPFITEYTGGDPALVFLAGDKAWHDLAAIPVQDAVQALLDDITNNDLPAKADLVGGKVPTSQLPALAITDVFTVANQAAMLALTAETGDVAVRTDVGKTFILSTNSPGTLADWKEIPAIGQVVSVAGRVGAVTLTKADVGLSNVTNVAQEPAVTAGTTSQYYRGDKSWQTLDKAAVGLGSVANVAQEPAIAGGTSSQFWRGDKTWVQPGLSDLASNPFKDSVRVATRAFGVDTTPSGGNITLSGTQTIDGVAVVTGDRVLVNGQTAAQNNGIYVVATGAWSRAGDANTAAKLAGAIVPVREGTVGGGSLWQTSFLPTDTLGTTTVPWQFFARSLELQTLLADTGWLNFTVGAGSGAFAGTGTVQYAQYRIVGQLVQVRMMRDVTTATTFGQYNYTNANITASGAIPAAARPSQTVNGAGRMDDSPIDIVLNSSGTISYTGGVPKSVAVGDNCDVTFMYFLG